MSIWKEVTKDNPCKICGKDNWCSVCDDGHMCQRSTEGGIEKTDKNGTPYRLYSRNKKKVKVFPAITDRAKSEVYTHLLEQLELDKEHFTDLYEKRGIPKKEIKFRQYSSYPEDDGEDILDGIVEHFGEEQCKHVPGLFYDKEWEGWFLSGTSGLLIPVRNIKKEIVALRVRTNIYGKKYIWLSSAKKEGGTGPGSPIHIPLHKFPIGDTIRITEGELKADIATYKTKTLTISIPGVSIWKPAIQVLHELKAKTVKLAFDRDFQTNINVARNMVNLSKEIKKNNFNLEIEIWDKVKGIDDALMSDIQIHVITGEDVDELIQEIEEEHNLAPVLNKKMNKADLADHFLDLTNRRTPSSLTLRYFNGDFYEFRVAAYTRINDDLLKANIIAWLQSVSELRDISNQRVANDILTNLKGTTLLAGDSSIPFWIGDNKKNTRCYISMANGLLDVDQLFDHKKSPLLPHDQNFFTLTYIPYDFKPDAKCPIFQKYLNQVQPSIEVQMFLQEWFGYNLIHDNSQETFVFFTGEGANGKTVSVTVLRLLLGNDNISAVGLEGFNPNNRFALSATVGKLANIVGDLNEINKVGEGMIKQFVSGETMTIERKHKAPFETKPTARLTYLMNILPRISDRSNGIWRRLIMLPWDQTIEEGQRDKRLIDPNFWIKSGELPGIFNWAMVGLYRLRKNGSFTKPLVCIDATDKYRMESNPHQNFLLEYCVLNEDESTATTDLYKAYKIHMEDNGHKPLSSVQFGKEVRKVYPEVEQTKNAVSQGNRKRSRKWIGLELDDTVSTGNSLF